MGEMTVSLVGSTGSIGTQAVDVIRANPDRFSVVALASQRSVARLAEQAHELRPALVAIGDEQLVGELAALVPPGTDVVGGPAGLEAAARTADVVQAARRTPGAEIVPVDSEHCAIHQCLQVTRPTDGPDPVRRLLVTASGGPFRGATAERLAQVTVADALAHPTWRMGPKITIDSSTLMNKGLEVIEAHELFGVPYDRIDVVVHPQSVVHSMVELVDGTTIAQLSLPDMRLPIGYALGWPTRLPVAFGPIDWSRPFTLTFEPPDRARFACLGLAYEAGRRGGGAPAWLNAANEVAVGAFLAGEL